jgi:hypothetical protein
VKVEVHSMWDSHRRRPNVWFRILGENDTEKALLVSIYSAQKKVEVYTSGEILVDTYPKGERR